MSINVGAALEYTGGDSLPDIDLVQRTSQDLRLEMAKSAVSALGVLGSGTKKCTPSSVTCAATFMTSSSRITART